MAQARIGPVYYPPLLPFIGNTLSIGSMLIDATGEKAAALGPVWWPADGSTTKDIRKVHFRMASIVKAGGSDYTLSLQNVSLTDAAPNIPDGTQDETDAVPDADITTNSWFTSSNLSADRTVAFGELLAVVIEFDGGGRLGSDTMRMAYWSGNASGAEFLNSNCTHYTAAWASMVGVPNILLEFSDGTFGTISGGGFPVANTVASDAFKSDTAGADEYGLAFQLLAPMTVAGFAAYLQLAAATSNFDVVLYQGLTSTAAVTYGSRSIDGNTVYAVTANSWVLGQFEREIVLAKDTWYVLAIKPTQTTSTVTLTKFTVAATGHLAVAPGGANCYMAKRIDAAADWTAVNTERPFIHLLVTGADDGAAVGSGGGPIFGGMVVR